MYTSSILLHFFYFKGNIGVTDKDMPDFFFRQTIERYAWLDRHNCVTLFITNYGNIIII